MKSDKSAGDLLELLFNSKNSYQEFTLQMDLFFFFKKNLINLWIYNKLSVQDIRMTQPVGTITIHRPLTELSFNE